MSDRPEKARDTPLPSKLMCLPKSILAVGGCVSLASTERGRSESRRHQIASLPSPSHAPPPANPGYSGLVESSWLGTAPWEVYVQRTKAKIL